MSNLIKNTDLDSLRAQLLEAYTPITDGLPDLADIPSVATLDSFIALANGDVNAFAPLVEGVDGGANVQSVAGSLPGQIQGTSSTTKGLLDDFGGHPKISGYEPGAWSVMSDINPEATMKAEGLRVHSGQEFTDLGDFLDNVLYSIFTALPDIDDVGKDGSYATYLGLPSDAFGSGW